MFTGIIEAVGKLEKSVPLEDGVRWTLSTGNMSLEQVRLGDSIAVNGVCLTVIRFTHSEFDADVSRASLDVIRSVAVGEAVNLERALKFGDPLGGHLVSGHVDGVGQVIAFEAVGESHRLEIEAPFALAKFIAKKGSIAVDGVSLTVNAVEGARFEINLIPHTLSHTRFSELKVGDRVNLEVDLIARYCERLLNPELQTGSGATG
jgi:riboflavin synthase